MIGHKYVVKTTQGYEEFINHLESEFSVENLLFLTEYLQLKFVIKKYHIQNKNNNNNNNNNNNKWDADEHQRIIDLLTNSKQVQFNIDLPLPLMLVNLDFSDNNINDDNGTGYEDITPDVNDGFNNLSDHDTETKEKGMGIRTASSLSVRSISASADAVRSVDNLSSIEVSVIVKNYCQDRDIIKAFKLLYDKYINPANAPFMINISHQKRQRLVSSLDCVYYRRQQASSRDRSRGLSVKKAGVKDMNINKQDENANVAMIDIEWEKHDKSTEWLLETLLSQMDQSAKEIAILMKDSFVRYKTKQEYQ